MKRSKFKRRTVTKQAEREGDPEYLAWVRTLPCCAPSVTKCKAPADAHHMTGAGMGMKAGDRETMPLCRAHHQAFHEGRWPFDGWSPAERRRWQEERIAACLAEHVVFEKGLP